MKPGRLLALALVAALLLSLSGCKLIVNTLSKVAESATVESPTQSASKPSSKATARPTAKSGGDKAQEDQPTEAPEDELVDPDSLRSLEGLDSYHLVQRGTFTDILTDTTETTTRMDIEVWEVKEPRASHTIYTSQKDQEPETYMEIISIGSETYMKSSDNEEWFAMSSSEPSTSSFGEIGWFTDPKSVMGSEGKYIGKEIIAGLPSKHYRYTGKSVVGSILGTGGVIETAQADVWVSEEYNIVVKYESRWKGTDEDGKQSDWSFSSEVTEVNQPITIEPPEGVAKPGLPDDVPMMDGATEVNAFAGIVSFKVSASLAEVMDYYKTALPDNGWEEGEGMGVEGMAAYTKDGRSLTLMVSEEDGSTSVTIMISEE